MSTNIQQQIEAQSKAAEEADEREAALGQASQAAAMDQGAQVPNESFFEEYGNADITPAPQDRGTIEEIVAAELSHHNLYGNITQRERERLQILNAGLAMQIKAEYPAPTGASSKCIGRYRKELLGEDKPVLTADMARKIESAVGQEGARSQMQSQSVNASAWKGITQIQSVAYTMGDEARRAGKGAISRAKDFLFGSD